MKIKYGYVTENGVRRIVRLTNPKVEFSDFIPERPAPILELSGNAENLAEVAEFLEKYREHTDRTRNASFGVY